MECNLNFSKKIESLVEKAINSGVFPGAAVGLFQGGERKKYFEQVYGQASLYPSRKLTKETLFDLASLTKPLATTLAILCLVQDGKISLDEHLPSLLEREIHSEKNKITLRFLLNHCAGFADHFPFYKKKADGVTEIKHIDFILQEKLFYQPGTQSVYSDLGFMLLKEIIEKKSGMDFEIFVMEKIFSPVNVEKKIVFNPRQKKKENFADTENCSWRKKWLSGEVHDDNCWAFGGVCGHAGLFGDLESVLKFVSFLLDVWKGRKTHPSFSSNLLQVFLKRQKIVEKSSWALGFDTPSNYGSSAGKYISRESVGHLGFTGTSFWIDPERELVMVLLTNRVHPSRENNLIREFRPVFHDTVIECVS